jgi:hypothetical protein
MKTRGHQPGSSLRPSAGSDQAGTFDNQKPFRRRFRQYILKIYVQHLRVIQPLKTKGLGRWH